MYNLKLNGPEYKSFIKVKKKHIVFFLFFFFIPHLCFSAGHKDESPHIEKIKQHRHLPEKTLNGDKNRGKLTNIPSLKEDEDIYLERLKEDSLGKIKEISRQIYIIKSSYNEYKSDSDKKHKEIFLKKIEDALFRISWRVGEISSYHKFNMGLYFPERNWIVMSYLSKALKKKSEGGNLTEILESISEQINDIERIIPIIEKLIEKGEAPNEKKEELVITSFSGVVDPFIDQEFLNKITETISTLEGQRKKEVGFFKNENNKRAVFRTLEIMGETLKYISPHLKKFFQNWLFQTPGSKKSIFTIIRNNFHHDRDKMELIFEYESGLLEVFLNTIFPFVKKQAQVATASYKQLTANKEILSFNVKDAFCKLKEIDRSIENSCIKGQRIKELLSFIEPKSRYFFYTLLLKRKSVPKTQEKFLKLVSENFIQGKDFFPEVRKKFCQAFKNLKGKKVLHHEVEEALKTTNGIDIFSIKKNIQKIVLEGKPCNKRDFEEQILRPLLFKGKDQIEGEKELEELRSLVCTDISSEAIKKVFDMSPEETEAYNKQLEAKALQLKGTIQGLLEILNSPKKNAKFGKLLSILVGITLEDKIILEEIFKKQLNKEIDEKSIRKKWERIEKVKKEIEECIETNKKFKGKINILGILSNISPKEKEVLFNFIKRSEERKNEEEKGEIRGILSKCFSSVEDVRASEKKKQRTEKKKQRTLDDIKKAKEILEKLPKEVEELEKLQTDLKKEILKLFSQQKVQDIKNLLGFLIYDPLKNKLRAKIKKIDISGEEVEKKLEEILRFIDENYLPQGYIRAILENGWLISTDTFQADEEKMATINKTEITWGQLENLCTIAKFDKSRIKGLHTKKLNHELTQEDINSVVQEIDVVIEQGKRQGSLKNLKEMVKILPHLSEEGFKSLIYKAGGDYEAHFQKLYDAITRSFSGIIPIKYIRDNLLFSIQKLDLLFETLQLPSKTEENPDILEMSTSYLIEEVGQLAGLLTRHPHYKESEPLCTSKKAFDLISMCRKSMAHYPLSISGHLKEYILNQVTLDTKARLVKDPHFSAQELSEHIYPTTQEEVEEKSGEIYAAIEGLGFKSDFKFFGKMFDCDVGVQRDWNLIVEPMHLTEKGESVFQKLIELEVLLSRILHSDVSVYTVETLQNMRNRVTEEHLEEIKRKAVFTLEDIILQNKYKRIFQEDRWSTFTIPDGTIFSRSQFLEQNDLKHIIDFFLEKSLADKSLENILEDQKKLQRLVKDKIDQVDFSQPQETQALVRALSTLYSLCSLYGTEFKMVYIPYKINSSGEISYLYFRLFGTHTKYKPINPAETTGLHVKRDKIFRQTLESVTNKNIISDPDLLAEEVSSLLHKEKEVILGKLAESQCIDEEKASRAISMEYAYSQEQLDRERQSNFDFRKQHLEETPGIKNIIREKARVYSENLSQVLREISANMKSLLLDYFFIEKEIEAHLIKHFHEKEEDITFLKRIMDSSQYEAASFLIEKGDPRIENINISFEHLKLKAINGGLPYLNNIALYEQIIALLTQKKMKFEAIISEIKRNDLAIFFPGSQISFFPGGCISINFPVPTMISSIPIFSPDHYRKKASKLIYKYNFMLSPITDPDVIKSLKNGDIIQEIVGENFFQKYCESETPRMSVSFSNHGKVEKKELADFSGEVEYARWINKIKLGEQLDQVEFTSLPSQLIELIKKRKGKKVPVRASFLGFEGAEKNIYNQVSQKCFACKFLQPNLLTEDIPSFVKEAEILEFGISSETKSTIQFSSNVEDLTHLMKIFGWSEAEIIKYKQQDNFEQDNLVIKNYFQYKRKYKNLESALLRKKRYEAEKERISKNLSESKENYKSFQVTKLEKKVDMYEQAIRENTKTLESLTAEIFKLPHVIERIEEELCSPDFLYDLCKKFINKEITDKEIEEIIKKKRETITSNMRKEIEVNVIKRIKKDKTVHQEKKDLSTRNPNFPKKEKFGGSKKDSHDFLSSS